MPIYSAVSDLTFLLGTTPIRHPLTCPSVLFGGISAGAGPRPRTNEHLSGVERSGCLFPTKPWHLFAPVLLRLVAVSR